MHAGTSTRMVDLCTCLPAAWLHSIVWPPVVASQATKSATRWTRANRCWDSQHRHLPSPHPPIQTRPEASALLLDALGLCLRVLEQRRTLRRRWEQQENRVAARKHKPPLRTDSEMTKRTQNGQEGPLSSAEHGRKVSVQHDSSHAKKKSFTSESQTGESKKMIGGGQHKK